MFFFSQFLASFSQSFALSFSPEFFCDKIAEKVAQRARNSYKGRLRIFSAIPFAQFKFSHLRNFFLLVYMRDFGHVAL